MTLQIVFEFFFTISVKFFLGHRSMYMMPGFQLSSFQKDRSDSTVFEVRER
jgi:hypothetical protein